MGLVPNCGFTLAREASDRNGLKVRIMNKKDTSKLRNNSFFMQGPEIYNSLSEDLRTLEGSMDSFKARLGSFLELVEDVPRLEGSSLTNNTLDKRINEWTWRLGCGPH